ncbi:MAG: class II glutamine amidotransferase [Candidatus Korarchaeota archaeon]|nr:class II glutamine amidotransferase [Candidatus Korarchaeota archaeon]
MCRMIAAISPSAMPVYAPLELVDALGRLALRGKSSDGLGHPHGWGILGLRRGHVVEYHRSTEPAWRASLDEAFRADLLILHARKASKGEVRLENTHPLVRLVGGRFWGLAHNGTIHGWEGLLEEGEREEMLGSTDTEALLIHLSKAGDLQSVMERLSELKESVDRLGVESITCLLTDGSSLLACRGASKRPDYYTLSWTRRGWKGIESLVFSSEPLEGWGAWTPLRNWSALLVRRVAGGLEVDEVDL